MKNYHIADSHAHIYDPEFDADRNAVIERACQAGVALIVMPATDSEAIKQTISTNRIFPEITRMAFGLHPESVSENYLEELARVKTWIDAFYNNPAFVAVGEIGLDYYWNDTFRQQQELVLRQQLEWATQLNMPVILHTRNAHDEMIQAVSEFQAMGLRGVFHSFTGSARELEQLLRFDNFLIGINGIVTFKKSNALRELLRNIPLSRLLIETDAPYLSPTPMRGKRNEPAYIVNTLEVIASVLECPICEVAQATFGNALRLFSRIQGVAYSENAKEVNKKE